MRNIVAAAALSTCLVMGVTYPRGAQAQSDVQSVIDALKPHPGKSRGSKPVIIPPGESSAPAATAASAPVHATATHMASVTPAVSSAPAQDDHPSLDFNITFASGSADLTPSATKILDTLGKALASTELANSKFRIEGHTDTVGSPEANKELSAKRAEAVVAYLSQHYSIAADRLTAVGMGEDSLLIQTGPNVNEQRNRRVHVVNVSG
jgi:outer membrane protein OmpA-like peptidoglycan-associated protein